jgi:hypothetical protein
MQYVHLTKAKPIHIRRNPILSSERLLHKDYDRKGSVGKETSLVVSFKELGDKTN